MQLDPDVAEAIDRTLGTVEEAYDNADQAEMKSPRQIVFQSLEIMREGLLPYVTAAARVAFGSDWQREVAAAFNYWRTGSDGHLHFDTQKLLQVMDRFWNNLFRSTLDRSHRSIVNELIDIRNRVAHDGQISEEDAERALDSMRRLLAAIGAHDAAGRIATEREEILRARYGKQSPAQVTASASSQPRNSFAAISTIAPTTTRTFSGGPSCMVSRIIGEVSITQGNIDNNHIYLRSIFDRFPADAKGGSNKASSADKTVTVDWGGPELVKTDLDGEKRFFRSRAWIAAFFRLNAARPGDNVRIEETGPYCYKVTLVR